MGSATTAVAVQYRSKLLLQTAPRKENNDCKAGGYKNNVRKGTKPYPILSAFCVSADRKILLRPMQISIKS